MKVVPTVRYDAWVGTGLRVQERFISLQGEGLLAGTPSSFIRVSGCNLRCLWCDSPATSWKPVGERADIGQLVDFCSAGPRHVVVTGGEPLLFPEVAELTQRLGAGGHHVTIETAGTTWLEGLHCDLASLSPKLAHSTPWERAPGLAARHESQRVNLDVIARARAEFDWQLKFVVRASEDDELRTDLEEVESILTRLGISPSERDRVLLMPEGTQAGPLRESYRRLVPICTAQGVRLGLRLHIELFGHVPGT